MMLFTTNKNFVSKKTVTKLINKIKTIKDVTKLPGTVDKIKSTVTSLNQHDKIDCLILLSEHTTAAGINKNSFTYLAYMDLIKYIREDIKNANEKKSAPVAFHYKKTPNK